MSPRLRDGHGDALRLRDDPLDEVPVHGTGVRLRLLPDGVRHALVVDHGRRRHAVVHAFDDRRIGLHVEAVALPAVQQRLVHDRDLHADRNHLEQRLDVLGVEPDAAVARTHADSRRLVGAVHQVARPAEVHRICPERIVRTRRHLGGQRITLLGVLLAHRRRWRPDGVLALGDDLGRADRRFPADLAYADRVGDDDRAGSVLRRFREIEEPHRRDVHHDAFGRGVGQHPLGRQHDPGALARQPRVHAGIRADAARRSPR